MVALHFAWPVYQWNLGMSRWWGLPFALAGLALVSASAARFARRTTLQPGEEPAELVTEGPFRYSRNPMYTGMLISLLGGWIMLGSVTPGIALPLFFWVLRAHFVAYEEWALERRFGEAYRSYRARVRRWL